MPLHERRTPKGSYGLGDLWRESSTLARMGVGGQILQLYFRAWYGMFSSPMISLLTVFTLGISLSILGVFVLFVENARGVLSLTEQALVVHVYLKEEVKDQSVADLKRDLERYQGVEKVRYLSKNDALAGFKKTLGDYSTLLEGVGTESSNPLPASFEVTFNEALVHEGLLKEFKQTFSKVSPVDFVQYSEGAISQLIAVVKFLRSAGIFTIIALCITTGFIIASTIMLALYSHRDEIRIMRLVGAREWTVRTPYIIEGFIKGVLGGGVAILIVYILFHCIKDKLISSTLFTYFVPHLSFLSVSGILLVVLVGLGVGIIGSYAAVRRSVPRG